MRTHVIWFLRILEYSPCDEFRQRVAVELLVAAASERNQ
jgi:hypothetical protein